MCQLDWAMGCLDCWLNYFRQFMGMLLKEISFQIGELSKENGPMWCSFIQFIEDLNMKVMKVELTRLFELRH